MKEVWRDIDGFPAYQISSRGRVRRLAHKITDSLGREYRRCQKILAVAPDSGGYPMIRLQGRRPIRIHTLVLESFVGPRPPKHDACHIDGNKKNNRVENLRWGTRADNERDKLAHGRSNRGEGNGMAVLTEDNIRHIRSSSLSDDDIASSLGVTPSCIWAVRTKKTWRHVR